MISRQRYHLACRATAKLMAVGVVVFSPLANSIPAIESLVWHYEESEDTTMSIENDDEIQCDRCGQPAHFDDKGGNCPQCGDDLCIACAERWHDDEGICDRCFREEKDETQITAVLEPSMQVEVKEKNKDIIAFGMSMDFSPLFQAISKKLGLVPTLEFSTPRIYECRGDFYVDCESVNIADRVGIFALVLDEVRAMFSSNRIDKDEDRGCYVFWAIIDFSYRHINRGTNGLEFATVWFDNEKGWTFKFVEPQNRD